MRAIQCTLLSLFFASSPASAVLQYNLTPGVTPLSHAIYHLHMTIFWICAAIGMIVFSVMFYSIIHHRKSQGAKAAQFHEHRWLELAWTLVPILILVLMCIPATLVLIHIRDTSTPDITIKITGFQWKWRYEYLDQDFSFFSNSTTSYEQIHNHSTKKASYLRTVDHPLVLPIHKKIRFLITSNDVVHSWWVPDLGTKQDAIPGFIIESWTRINRPGTYHGQCAELCGINHAYMPIVVTALAEKDFNDWVILQKGGTLPMPSAAITATVAQPVAATLESPPSSAQIMQQGQQIYMTTCAMCHQPTGEGLPPTYPALKANKTITGPVPIHINRVLFGKPGTAMQAFKDQFNDEAIAAVTTYERNAWGNHAGTVQASDVQTARARGPLKE